MKRKAHNVIISIEIMLRIFALFAATVALLVDCSLTTILAFALCSMALTIRVFDEIVQRDSLHSLILRKEVDIVSTH